MTLRLLYILITLLLTDVVVGQGNTIYGKVTFPEVSKKLNISRGTQYRNRLNQISQEDERSQGVPMHQQVVISLHPLDFKPNSQPRNYEIIQKNKAFVPSVLPIAKGSTIQFINNDDFYHNVFSLTPRARFNIGRRKPGKVVSKKIDKEGVIKIFCDIHPQMNAIVLSFDTPYFTTLSDDGTYNIVGLPDGRYSMKYFHSSMSFPDQEIVLKGGKRLEKNYASSYIFYPNNDFEQHTVLTDNSCCSDKGSGCEN